jgi:phospholipid/cholesterol/gamma-HCH transport system substrate-binding protein
MTNTTNKSNKLEIFAGLFVIAAAVLFFIYINSIYKSNSAKNDGYILIAKFQNAGGIIEGNDVILAGIRIGKVENMYLDINDYSAIVKIKINNDVKLPKDSQFSIFNKGILGDKFINVSPGAESEFLKNGNSVMYTQSAINVEDLVFKLVNKFIEPK